MRAHSPATIDVVVFDVLGTMVDEPGGQRAALREVAPDADDAAIERWLALWRDHVDREQQHILTGHRPFATTDVIDREAAALVAEHAGRPEAPIIDRLAAAGRHLDPWADSAAELARLSGRFPVVGLSNASRTTLLHLNAHAGLSWHAALSAEDVQTYKPAVEVYRQAIDVAGCPPERILMVAAHAWDLRGAQAAGMRTAYVPRPVGDPPTDSDTFDWTTGSLSELISDLMRS